MSGDLRTGMGCVCSLGSLQKEFCSINQRFVEQIVMYCFKCSFVQEIVLFLVDGEKRKHNRSTNLAGEKHK